MKLLFMFFTVTITYFSSNQNKNISGTYQKIVDAPNGYIDYTLNLNADGTFDFHSYQEVDQSLDPPKDR